MPCGLCKNCVSGTHGTSRALATVWDAVVDAAVAGAAVASPCVMVLTSCKARKDNNRLHRRDA